MYETILAGFQALPETAQFLTLVAVSLVSAKLIQIFSLKIVKRFVLARDGELSKIAYDELHRPIYITVALIGIYLSISEVNFVDKTVFYLEAIVLTITTAVWGWALNRTGDRILEFVKESESSRFDYEFAPIFENLWTVIVSVVSLFFIISVVWDVNLTPFLASAGILGVVGGLAARDTIANFFGGMSLYFDNTYKLGDYVVLDAQQEHEGIVVDIGIRSTNLKTRDDQIITVPNSILNSATIVNQSAPDTRGRLTIPVAVSYDADIEKAEEAMLEVADEANSVLEHPSPRVRMRNLGDSGLEYDLLCWIPNPIERPRTTHKVNRAIVQKFREYDIEIPYPHRKVLMDSEKTLDDFKDSEE
jgi:small-conductance mechanosensitive channel